MSSPPPPSTTSPADPPPPPPPRKFPAPCWTQEETLALIRAYQDKWYSLRRRNLRTADWEAVATDVSRRCPDQSPPKTSAQCRHKMEKLRKRYRTEKQRFLSLPHNPHHARFFSPSSWVFFDLMEAMEAGSNPQDPNLPPSGIPLKPVTDNVKPDLVDKPVNLKGHKEDFGKYFDEILMGMSTAAGVGVGIGAAPIKFKVKNHHHHLNHFDDPNQVDDDDYYDGSRSDFIKGGTGRNPIPLPGPLPGSKRKSSGQDYDDRFDYDPSPSRKILNGGSKSGFGSGSGSRTRDSLAEMVTSIKMLGEGLVKMEKMKMDMMREIETMRMEMEMKRSEMILESQQLIVNAFVEGLKKNNSSSNKVVKVMEVE